MSHRGKKNDDPSDPVVIREMELEDIPHVFALGEQLFTAELWPSLYRTWDEYEPVRLFAGDGDFCLVADQADKIVGFAMGSMIEKRKSAWSYGYLQWIGVDPEATRRGIASRLTNRMTELFIEAGARMMIIDTDAENENAIAFFKNHGFGNELEHVYMSKNLTSHPEYRRLRRKGGLEETSE
jgi:ribosomal protein S18 acetylase RimI-like enzyme